MEIAPFSKHKANEIANSFSPLIGRKYKSKETGNICTIFHVMAIPYPKEIQLRILKGLFEAANELGTISMKDVANITLNYEGSEYDVVLGSTHSRSPLLIEMVPLSVISKENDLELGFAVDIL